MKIKIISVQQKNILLNTKKSIIFRKCIFFSNNRYWTIL